MKKIKGTNKLPCIVIMIDINIKNKNIIKLITFVFRQHGIKLSRRISIDKYYFAKLAKL